MSNEVAANVMQFAFDFMFVCLFEKNKMRLHSFSILVCLHCRFICQLINLCSAARVSSAFPCSVHE